MSERSQRMLERNEEWIKTTDGHIQYLKGLMGYIHTLPNNTDSATMLALRQKALFAIAELMSCLEVSKSYNLEVISILKAHIDETKG